MIFGSFWLPLSDDGLDARSRTPAVVADNANQVPTVKLLIVAALPSDSSKMGVISDVKSTSLAEWRSINYRR